MHLEIGQVLSQIVAFLFTLWILKRYAWKPILTVLDARREKIKSEFELIENKKADLEELSNRYHAKLRDIDAEARMRLQEAIDEGREISTQLQNEARHQSKLILDRAHASIEKELIKAKIQLKNDVVDLTMLASEKIIKENLSDNKNKQLIENFVEQVNFK